MANLKVLLFMLCICSVLYIIPSEGLSSNLEIEALKAFKSLITNDPIGALADWIDRTHHCNWSGIACDPSSNAVVSISLSELQLQGKITPFLGNISSLQTLDLSSNSFSGSIPTELHLCSELTELLLSNNSLSDAIPTELGNLKKLQVLDLSTNFLDGSIPASIGNCTALIGLGLPTNKLTGTIPLELGNLKELQILDLSENFFNGTIPTSIINCTSLTGLDFSTNNLTEDIFNCTELTRLDLARNNLSGSLKPGIGKLTNLRNLRLFLNSLTGKIPQEIGNLSMLISLDLSTNGFSGPIPSSISNLSALQGLSLYENAFHGAIPEEIFELKQLSELKLQENRFSGLIPNSVSKLKLLSNLDLHGNMLSGPIPRSMGDLKGLMTLDLSHNRLIGSVPAAMIVGMKNIQIYLNLSNNFLVGSIPDEIGGMQMVQAIDISNNNLTGSIPASIGGCRNLGSLDLSRNAVSGQIPARIFNQLDLLMSLNLSGNKLDGEIPSRLSELKYLVSLDLSQNEFSGRIPVSLGNLTSLKHLNLSFNQLEGSIPNSGIFQNLSSLSLDGNPFLCGTKFLSPCIDEIQKTNSRRISKKVTIILIILSSIFVSLLVVCVIIAIHRCITKPKTEDRCESKTEYSVAPSLKRFTQEDLQIATDFFNERNVIGHSSLSTVYRGRIDDGWVIAVKKLNLEQFAAESDKCFDTELKILNQLRHKNLVKMVGYAWEYGKFKALVLEFMENGSLESVIHDSGTDGSRWSLSERVNLFVSVANGLVYLHCDYGFPIVHCDLKPSNILLDRDWIAHVSDFGTSRMLGVHLQDGSSLSLASSFQGTIGYLAPEFAYMSRVTTKADVFSFGVIMMEFLTKRRPTGTIEDDGVPITLRHFVENAVRNGTDAVLRVVDHDLVSNGTSKSNSDEIVAILELALSCTRAAPEDRPDMNEVLSVLLKINDGKM
ncbi:LRR receptor-like serine/threonine-protein kinase FLS2 isoform X2 [Magnolia sinica]|uniref:LRR receptor-like serine/threonine-protein kinase FLS2 isoform X2 n=1 Tax=Magnolia sinica TaxID=86752 RepID=UPI00265AABB1|nr:LRR receptor-like serine/threonine-protein kinase FLS2 isoform X2 [Magnolia sinica]